MSKPTPLHDQHVGLGAMMTDFAGWAMPLRYGSESTEHRAVRTAAGIFDLSHMGEIEIAGAEAVDALDHALISDIGKVGVGGAKYTMICAEDGGILDDLIVYRLGENRYLVVANAANAEVVLDELRARAEGFDAEVSDNRDDYALIAIQGPRAAAIMAGLTDAELEQIRYYAAGQVTVAGVSALLARTGYTGEDGFEIFCAAEDATAVWTRALAAGTGYGLIPTGLACRDTLRLEAGMPLYGHELSREVSPYSANLGRVVALKKPEFVGRDALANRAEKGEPRRLVGLVTSGRRPPRAGYPVHDEDGATIGEVTSGGPSPTLGHPIAMAYLDTDHTEPEHQVAIDIRGSSEPARVVPLPFYRRPR
ncbi:MAG TPA: glycine cleavage system aminomethyltransferase GcvT [Pseudonocardia sp.]|uniref:glycine cleavage system aminomethyltransferase GcvT n=1 Tax=Pseudonocardia sp. TaxID=60912 RepID=UPI002ED9843A